MKPNILKLVTINILKTDKISPANWLNRIDNIQEALQESDSLEQIKPLLERLYEEISTQVGLTDSFELIERNSFASKIRQVQNMYKKYLEKELFHLVNKAKDGDIEALDYLEALDNYFWKDSMYLTSRDLIDRYIKKALSE